MARKIQVLLVDDLDGTDLGENGTTVSFGFQGHNYEIDLSDKNAKAMTDALGRYVQHARKADTSSTRRGSRRSPATGHDGDTKAARAWLIEHGFLTDASRGRISKENWERYNSRGQMALTSENVAAATVEASKAMKARQAETPVTTGAAEASKPAKTTPPANSRKPEKAESKDKAPAGVTALLP